MRELKAIRREIRDRVRRRLDVFHHLRERGTDLDFFTELVFCLLTPQTRARQAEKAVDILASKNWLLEGAARELASVLNIVRFRYNKARYIVEARRTCSRNGRIALRAILDEIPSVADKRLWLSQNVLGLGFKEASHFLRNTGYGRDLAILDRHVLRNLKRYGFIRKTDISLTPAKYAELEKKLKGFSRRIGIPLEELDFVLLYREIRDVFK